MGKIQLKQLLLYAITDRSTSNLFDDVKKALDGGITMLQLREKNLSEDEFIQEAIEIKRLCSEYNVPLIINDNMNVCIAADADGVHLGQSDMPSDKARKLLGNDKIIGVTAKTIEQAQTAEKNGADYLGSGAIFGTSTKKDAIKMDMDTLKSICGSVKIPVVAIGGITGENVTKLKGTGICGVAVVSGIFGQPDIKDAAMDLYKKTKNTVN